VKPILPAIWLVMLNLIGASTAWAETPPPAKPVVERSVFTQPNSPREGRDPFFPESPRPYESAQPAKRGPEIFTYLKSPGYSETGNKRYVIINNHTFSVGDEGDVLTSAGRLHLRCLEIRTNLTVVEFNGQRREIHFSPK
jgi:hypothetical protein